MDKEAIYIEYLEDNDLTEEECSYTSEQFLNILEELFEAGIIFESNSGHIYYINP